MADEFIQFGLCVRGDKGFIHLSDAGIDVFRAFIMKLMEQAQNGEDKARAMGTVKGNDYSKNQAAYFKAAKTFLAGVLVGQLTPKMNLRSQLVEAHSWRAMNSIPDRWSAAVADAASEVNADGIIDTASGGGGAGGDGGTRVDPVGSGSDGKGNPPPPPDAGEADHRTESKGTPGRAATQSKGKRRAN